MVLTVSDASEVEYFVEVAYGGAHNRGRTRKALAAMASGIDQSDSYCSLFWFGEELKAWIAANRTAEGLARARPVHYAPFLPFDIDTSKGEDLGYAHTRAKGLVTKLEALGVDGDSLQIWFSGKKGFHIMVPAVTAGIEPSEWVNDACRRVALEIEPATDRRFYDLTRLCRLPHSIHADTKLRKIPLTKAELFAHTVDEIKALASARKPVPAWKEAAPAPRLAALFERAISESELEYERTAIAHEARAAVVAGVEQVDLGAGAVFELKDALERALSAHWVEGQRHTLATALAGYLANKGIPADEACALIEHVALRCNDTEVSDRVRCASDTYKAFAGGAVLKGYRSLEEALGKSRDLALIDKAVAAATKISIRPASSSAAATAPASPSTGPTEPPASMWLDGPATFADAGLPPPVDDNLPPPAPDPDNPSEVAIDWPIEDMRTIGELPKPSAIIAGVIPDDARVVLSGPPKGARKTWLLLHLALCIISGQKFLGQFEVLKPGPVFFYSGEEPKWHLQKRLWQLARGWGCEGALPMDNPLFRHPFHILDRKQRVRLDTAGDRAKLRMAIEKYKPSVVIADPLVHLHHTDENDAGAMASELLEPLSEVVGATGTTLVLCHHISKGENDGGMRMRGTTALWGWYDAGLHAQPVTSGHEGDAIIKIGMDHRRFPPQPDIHFKISDALPNTSAWRTMIDATPPPVKQNSDGKRKSGIRPSVGASSPSEPTSMNEWSIDQGNLFDG